MHFQNKLGLNKSQFIFQTVFCTIFTWHNLGVLSAWKSADCAKHCFKNQWTLKNLVALETDFKYGLNLPLFSTSVSLSACFDFFTSFSLCFSFLSFFFSLILMMEWDSFELDAASKLPLAVSNSRPEVCFKFAASFSFFFSLSFLAEPNMKGLGFFIFRGLL